MGEQPKAVVGEQPKGQGFFSVDRRTWEAATNLPGLNPALAFLVLARFSDKSNTKTSASVHAVEEHTGISRARSKVAVDALLKAGLIRRTNAVEAVRPLYEIHVPESKSELIWLPNAIVTGVSGEKPPIARLREAHDVLLLRLFVDLYRVQNLRESHGIDRRILSYSYAKESAGSAAGFDLWRFVPDKKLCTPSDAFDWRVYSGKGDDKEAGPNFWQRMETLGVLGLIKWVAHLYNSADDDGEVLYAYGTEGTEDIEDKVGQAAHDAAVALIEQTRGSEPADVEEWLVPIRRHMKDVAMVGVVRLRYRARTSLTASWWAEHQKKGEAALADFQNIRERAEGLRP